MASQPGTTAHVSHSFSDGGTLRSWVADPRVLFRLGLVLILALYIRSIAFDFVYDDLFIPVSPLIQSWHGIVDAFKTELFAAGGQAAASAYYRPLAGALVVLIARLTPGNPGWFHLVSLLLELAVYGVTYLFGRLFFEEDRAAALTAILFALHPTKVETIAWIGSASCDGQVALYFFATLACYLQWWKQRNPVWLAASALCFLAAMFTKETMIVLPVLIAVHYWLRSTHEGRFIAGLRLMSPYAAGIGAYMVARRAVIRPLATGSIAIHPQFTVENLWSAPAAFWWYVRKLVAPTGLSILYDPITLQQFSVRGVLVPLLGLAAFALIIWRGWRRYHSWRLLFLLSWFILTLAPAVAMEPLVTVHDRYLQLAAYPFCAMLTFAILWFSERHSRHTLSGGICIALIVAWSAITWHQVGFWDNSMSLWGRAVQIAPHNINARVELARLNALNDVPAAIRVLDDGLKQVPSSPGLWRTRGLLLFNAGRLDESRFSFLKALEVSARYANGPEPEPIDVKFGRATAAFFLAEIEMLQGRPAAADPWLRQALAINPKNPDYIRVMIANLNEQGRKEEALRLQQALDQQIHVSAERPR